MEIRISFENVANHPDYDRQVSACQRHGQSLRQWNSDVWFCQYCGHRVVVKTVGVVK